MKPKQYKMRKHIHQDSLGRDAITTPKTEEDPHSKESYFAQISLWVQAAFQGGWPSCGQQSQKLPFCLNMRLPCLLQRRAPRPQYLPLSYLCLESGAADPSRAFVQGDSGGMGSLLLPTCHSRHFPRGHPPILRLEPPLIQGPVTGHLSLTICSGDINTHQCPCALPYLLVARRGHETSRGQWAVRGTTCVTSD